MVDDDDPCDGGGNCVFVSFCQERLNRVILEDETSSPSPPSSTESGGYRLRDEAKFKLNGGQFDPLSIRLYLPRSGSSAEGRKNTSHWSLATSHHLAILFASLLAIPPDKVIASGGCGGHGDH